MRVLGFVTKVGRIYRNDWDVASGSNFLVQPPLVEVVPEDESFDDPFEAIQCD